MRTQTFQLADAQITVRSGIGSDIWDEDIVMVNLGSSIQGHPLIRVNKFIECVVRSTVDGNLGFEWPQAVTDAERMATAYNGWRELSREDLTLWQAKLDEVNTAPGDPAIQPMDVPAGEASLPT